MRSRGLASGGFFGRFAAGLFMLVVPLGASVRAGAPAVTISATGAKIQVVSASLVETLDTLSRAAGFKVTYEGPRPTAMLFNSEIDTPTVSQTLIRLLDGQNLNYGVVFDLSGKRVTKLMIFGVTPRTSGTAATPSRPQPFATPRNPRETLPPVNDEPAESSEPEPAVPEPTPSPTAAPRGPGGQASPGSPFPPSPFAPRPFGGPFGPRPTPVPLPSPSP